MNFKGIILVFGSCFLLIRLFPQDNISERSKFSLPGGSSNFDPAETFNPVFYSHSSNEYRTSSGKPGPKYWQNRADYKISATLDTIEHSISGQVDILYTNNSPDKLPFIWLQLDQNARKATSRDALLRNAMKLPDPARHSNGLAIGSVTIKDGQEVYSPDYIIDDTRMQIRLKKAQNANGAKIGVSITYRFTIPGKDPVRMGRQQSPEGWIYQVAQWYPRMEVYDDVEGWNSFPYIQASEFYLEFGSFSYSVTLPANMIVVGSGKLVNEREVLPSSIQQKLEQARTSDSTIIVARPGELRDSNKELRTWKFECANSRDVAWAASAGFVWDASRINLPGGKTAVAMSAYPPGLSSKWNRSTQYTKYTIEYNSRKWYPYPYPFAVNVAGSVSGMEYPGLAFCENADMQLVAHEFSHTWFPMIVGSNERKYPWMDEGLTAFLASIVVEEYKKDMKPVQPARVVKPNIQSKFFGNALMNFPLIAGDIYGKTELALMQLRNIVLGQDRFDFAIKQYLIDWAFKHPTPWDFFNAIENAAGEDLDWFWRGWLLNNWKLDQAIYDIKYIDSADAAQGSVITIRNNEKMVMPLFVTVIQEDNSRLEYQFPVEIWMKGADYKFRCNSNRRIIEVIIDEKGMLPDVNKKNNVYKNDKLVAQQQN